MTIDHKLMRWFTKHQGETVKEADIRRELDISHGTFHQARARLLAAGLLRRRKAGALYIYDLPEGVADTFGAAAQVAPPPVRQARAAQPEEAGGEDQELPDLSGQYGDLDEVEDAVLAIARDVSYSLEGDRFVVESSDGLHLDVYEILFHADFVQVDLLSRG